jgi:alpha-L-fucosidase
LTLPIYLKGISSQPKQIDLIGSNEPIQFTEVGKISWSTVPGTLFIEIPINEMDPQISVIKVQFDQPIQLYRGRGGFH